MQTEPQANFDRAFCALMGGSAAQKQNKTVKILQPEAGVNFTMLLSVQKGINRKKYKGNYKTVEPTKTRCSKNGVEYIKYGFVQSGGRFERENVSFKFIVQNLNDRGEGAGQPELLLGTIDWAAMNAPDDIYKMLLNKGKIGQIKEMFHPGGKEFEDLINAITAEIDKCIQAFKDEYHNSEEYKISKQNQKRIERWLKAKARFDKEYGTGYFEEIYNFDLDLVNVDLLAHLRQKKRQSEGYRQERNGSAGSSHHEEKGENPSGDDDSTPFSEDEVHYLKRFYKTLAKKYHPDVSYDDGKAMQLLNKLKEHWKL
ncbi:MAG: hypothetical protein P4M02_04490 [Clostridia bacterium]|nr:hypothetical protein [Clostridia bacterium]